MAGHFTAALKLVLEDPSIPIARTQLMNAEEQERLLVHWNSTDRAYPLHKTLIDLFQESVSAWPERVALEYEGKLLTYRELNLWAENIGRRLRAASIKTDDVVGITLDRSPEFVAAVLGVMKCGGAYLPIDAHHPPERLIWMLENAAVRAQIGPLPSSVPQVEAGSADDEQESPEEFKRDSDPDAACYVIFTSGSTGVPKGVVVNHRAIVNNLLWMNDEWPLTAEDAVLFKSSPGFDVSVKEIFWPLIAGA